MQNQPKICHAQFFRLVVMPAGVYQCSLWRGFDNARIIDANKPVTDEYFQELHENRIKVLESFNAREICKNVSCLYAPLNYWVEGLRPEGADPISDFNDYFL